MHEIEIRLCSVQDVQEFVALATTQPFPVQVGNTGHKVNAKSFMEMFCLDFTRPMTAAADCCQAEFDCFCQAADRFRVR